MQTRQSNRAIPAKKYNPYGDDFEVVRIYLKKMTEETVGLREKIASKEADIVDNRDHEWVEDRSKPEVEVDDELQRSYEQDLTNLRVLEWLNEMTTDPKETKLTMQDVDRGTLKYLTSYRPDSSWVAQGVLLIPASNLHSNPVGNQPGRRWIFLSGKWE